SVARAPSAAMLLAALRAPPGTISVESYSRISTGASRETRATRPYTNSSATRSPITTTLRDLKESTSERSWDGSTRSPLSSHKSEVRSQKSQQKAADAGKDSIRHDPFHAAVVDRAFTEHAGAAPDRMREDLGVAARAREWRGFMFAG